MGKVKVNAVADPSLVATVIWLVNNLDRGINKATGKPYVGLRQDRCPIVSLFFDTMAAMKHPLADEVNKKCTHDNACHECRRDVYESAISQAEAMGEIVTQGRKGREYKKPNGEMAMGQGYALLFRKGESTAQTVSADFVAKMLENARKALA